jgi:hypothetical protein
MRENLAVPPALELGFEVLGLMDDDLGLLRAPALAGGPSYAPGPKNWVRFFRVLPNGDQQTEFCCAFNALDFVIFTSNPRRYRCLIEPNAMIEGRYLSPEEQAEITKILLGRRGNPHLVFSRNAQRRATL